MEWLYEDAVFGARWAELFRRVLEKGNRVKIIHTVARDIHEMPEAVTKWLPIYMSGALEPYFCPKLRDGLWRRTLFIAPDTAAVVSSSVQQNTNGMLKSVYHRPCADTCPLHGIRAFFRSLSPADADSDRRKRAGNPSIV